MKAEEHLSFIRQRYWEQLRGLFPEVFIGGKLDVQKLSMLLGDHLSSAVEKYEFTWPGKTEAIQKALSPPTCMLIPDPSSSKQWSTTENLYIEGDNLEVLKLLQQSFMGRIKAIYIDPPYNTGQNFVYKDNFRKSKRQYKGLLGDGVRDHHEYGRYHADWLNMMYPRLKLARELLRDDGVIFISIDEREHANLRKLCDEIFGEDNFIETFVWFKTLTPPSLSIKTRKTVEYVLCYEKIRNRQKYRGEKIENGDAPLLNYGNPQQTLTFPPHTIRFSIADGVYPAGQYDKVKLLNTLIVRNGMNENEVRFIGEFKWTQKMLEKEIEQGTYFLVKSMKFSIRFQRLMSDIRYKPPTNFIPLDQMDLELSMNYGIGTNESATREMEKLHFARYFPYTKPVSLIKYLLRATTMDEDWIMDFFSGTATTAHAVMQLNVEDGGRRKFIMVQLPEEIPPQHEANHAGYKNLCELGKERIRRAGDLIVAETGIKELDIGFKVYRCV